MATMTAEARKAFLSGLHVGVLSLNEPGRGPLTAPVWYDYTAQDELVFFIHASSRKGRLLAVGTRISLCAQTETPPYQYVSVEGPVTTITGHDVERDLRTLARRYLGELGGDEYVNSVDLSDIVLVRVRPERWLSVDFSV
jgi:PPOX class probable F420-dependent enzyme